MQRCRSTCASCVAILHEGVLPNHLDLEPWLSWRGKVKEVCVSVVGEKRKPAEPLHHEENKRPRVLGDIPMDLINEVMSTIADPAAIPEVIT